MSGAALDPRTPDLGARRGGGGDGMDSCIHESKREVECGDVGDVAYDFLHDIVEFSFFFKPLTEISTAFGVRSVKRMIRLV